MTKAPTTKHCGGCGVIKDTSAFPKRRNRKGGDGLDYRCRECHAKKWKDYYSENSESVKKQKRQYREANRDHIKRLKKQQRKNKRFHYALYGLNGNCRRGGYALCTATVNQIAIAFTGRCHVCDISEDEHGKVLYIDHDHITGNFRGWLCYRCNTAIGMMRDSPDLIIALAEYAQNHS